MKKILTALAVGGSILVLSACNTVKGMGEDIESVGECADGVEGNC
ncbi:entericidin A/B family lipoprotein [Croceicoccus bisphenolivorans]|nr:entericidin A/B family lipoprotein [Croceicoccus bisphenolivorans]